MTCSRMSHLIIITQLTYYYWLPCFAPSVPVVTVILDTSARVYISNLLLEKRVHWQGGVQCTSERVGCTSVCARVCVCVCWWVGRYHMCASGTLNMHLYVYVYVQGISQKRSCTHQACNVWMSCIHLPCVYIYVVQDLFG